MINMIVVHVLEVIFGLFLILVLAKNLLGIDIVRGLMKLYSKIVYGKSPSSDDEDGKGWF